MKELNLSSKKFNLKTSLKTKKTIKQQKCPGEINFNERSNNPIEISNKLSSYFRNLFKK